MFAFAFNQGYICGIFGTSLYVGFSLKKLNNLEYLEWEPFVIESVKKSKYFKELSKIFGEEEIADFEDGLKLGTFNGVAFNFNEMNMYFWDSKQYDKMDTRDEVQKHFGVYGISKIGKNIIYKGIKIGDVKFMQAWGIPDYITYVPIDTECNRCGFTKFCNCYGFSSISRMTGCHGHHFGHSICIICGEPGKSWKNFMCKNCYDPSIKSEEDYRKEDRYKSVTDFRHIVYHEMDSKRTFFKEKNLKCLECKKEVDPMVGLVACSRECVIKLLELD